MSEKIQIFNRKNQKTEIERIMGEAPMRKLYGTRLGLQLARILSTPWMSQVYGKYQASGRSKKAIPQFIETFQIPMEEFEVQNYPSFNDFFIRKFKPGQRNFPTSPKDLGAPAEGRYFAFESITDTTPLPIKGVTLNVRSLLGEYKDTVIFQGGPGFIARLCPVDYHRFHFPDSGKILRQERLPGPLHSVNPIALKAKGDILFTNERFLSILETENFGKIAYLEVGALCVGRIVQSHAPQGPFKRGDEKGYFLFGASTVIMVGEPGRWKLDLDLIERTKQGVETLVRLGDKIASSAQ